MTAALELLDVEAFTPRDHRAAAMRLHPGVWAEQALRYDNQPFHWEWYELMMRHRRLAIVAPRDSAKTQVLTVNSTAHACTYMPGCWTHVFGSTVHLGYEMLERVIEAVAVASPWLLNDPPKLHASQVIFSNWSRITVGSVGRPVRGMHPDRIVLDDVLTDERAGTNAGRQRMRSWLLGTVLPMAHPPETRLMQWGRLRPSGRPVEVSLPATRIVFTGTPFHQLDALMDIKENPIWRFFRYASVFEPDELVPGTWAVEAA